MKSDQLIDKAADLRNTEEVNTENLIGWLSETLNTDIAEIQIRQFPGGYSNLTFLINCSGSSYVLRRPPKGANIKSAHDMSREFRILSLLKPHYPKVPKPVAYCSDDSVIGSDFYMMERVEGVILRGQLPRNFKPNADLMRSLSESLVENLASLHGLDVEKAGLMDFGKPDGYIERQVTGWVKRYYKSQTDPIPEMDSIADWMPQNMPISRKVSVIHNDYKYDNLVLDPDHLPTIKAVLDWEMATIGDPLMDLGTTLAYWAEDKDSDFLKPFNPSWLPGNLNRVQVIQHYANTVEKDLSEKSMLFYYVFGLFKVAVIGQQIYARYKKGIAKDPRFGLLIEVVKHASLNGVRAMATGRVSNYS